MRRMKPWRRWVRVEDTGLLICILYESHEVARNCASVWERIARVEVREVCAKPRKRRTAK